MSEMQDYQSSLEDVNSRKFETLPMFGETDVDTILAEAAACHAAHPNNHVRLIGFDNYAQSKGTEMVIYRGKPV